MMWLLDESTAAELRTLFKTRTAAMASAHQERFNAHVKGIEAAARDGKIRSMSVAGDTAEIRVEGVLTPKLDFWLWLFDIPNTAYADVQAAVAAASADPSVKKINFFFNSPGGSVDSLFETIEAIQGVTKPNVSQAQLAASAAYGMAAATKRVEATSASATFGSVGVVATYLVDEDLVEITSTEAPDKRPDPQSEEGKATIRAYLDAIHDLFAGAIAHGRGTTVAKVNSDFGRGAVLLAGDAKKRGMIDKVNGNLRLVSNTKDEQGARSLGAGGEDQKQEETKIMDLQTLKAQHPALCEALRAEGAEAALKNERDRVEAHLIAGEASGDMKTALAAVKGGTAMTTALQTQYMMAAANRGAVTARQQETNSAGAVLDGAQPVTAPAAGAPGATGDTGDQAAALMAQKRGKVLNG